MSGEKKDVLLLDGYIFSGLSDELKQQIVVVASGRQDVAERARQFFNGLDKTIYFAEGEFCTSRLLSLSDKSNIFFLFLYQEHVAELHSISLLKDKQSSKTL